MQLFNFVKKWLGDSQQSEQRMTPKHWVLILAALGLAFMIFSNYFSISGQMNEQDAFTYEMEEQQESTETFGSSTKTPTTMTEYEEMLENQLKDILSKVSGVGDVSVMINLDATEEVIFEKDLRIQSSTTEEADQGGGKRQIEDSNREEQVVVLRHGNNEEPLIIKTKKPKVRGVVVVAEGADNIQVKSNVTEAVTRVLDVKPHRVSVLPKK